MHFRLMSADGLTAVHPAGMVRRTNQRMNFL